MGKGVLQGCILSPCLLNLYAEYIMKMLGWMNHKLESRLLEQLQICRGTYVSTLMSESEDELKSLLMRMKEVSKKAGLKLDIQ